MKKNEKEFVTSKNPAILGVCGGLSEFFNSDPSLIRLLFIFILLGDQKEVLCLIYILLWIMMKTNEDNIKNKK